MVLVESDREMEERRSQSLSSLKEETEMTEIQYNRKQQSIGSDQSDAQLANVNLGLAAEDRNSEVQPSSDEAMEIRQTTLTSWLTGIFTNNKTLARACMVIVIILFCCRLFSFIIFTIFDIVCFAYEKSSITKCSERVLFSNPLPLVHLWLAASNVTSVIILLGLLAKPSGVKFCGFKPAYKQLRRSASFWSLNLILATIMIDYIVRLIHEDTSSKQVIPFGFATLKLLDLLIVYSVNFVHPIQFPSKPRSFRKVFIWITYWLGLTFHLAENFHLFISNSLDAMESIYPLGQPSSDEDRAFLVMLSLILGAKVAFHIRVTSFFWTKLFHGNKNIFSVGITLEDIQD